MTYSALGLSNRWPKSCSQSTQRMKSALTRGKGVANKFGNKIKILSLLHEAGGHQVFLNTSALLNTDGSSKISRGSSKSATEQQKLEEGLFQFSFFRFWGFRIWKGQRNPYSHTWQGLSPVPGFACCGFRALVIASCKGESTELTFPPHLPQLVMVNHLGLGWWASGGWVGSLERCPGQC